MPDTTNDIDALLRFLSLASRQPSAMIFRGFAADSHAALTALVAERDALKQRVAELEASSKPRYILGGGRVESIDLRERLVCAALTGAMTQEGWRSRDAMAAEVVATGDATLAALRKGETNA